MPKAAVRLPILAALLLLAGQALPTQARANVIYDLEPGITTGTNGQPTTPLSFQLVLYDNFVPGPFSRTCSFGSCSADTGSFSDFQLTAYKGPSVLGVLDATFDPAYDHTSGTFLGSSGTLSWDTSAFDIALVFGNGVWSSSFNSDAPPYSSACQNGTCTASGAMVQVPEPASVAIFAMALAALVALRRRRGITADPMDMVGLHP